MVEKQNNERREVNIEADPQEETAVGKMKKITRRAFLRASSIVGGLTLADLVSGGQLHQIVLPEDDTEELDEHEKAEVDDLTDKVIEDAQNTEGFEELSPREKSLLYVHMLGTALFAWGVRNLLPGGDGHISAAKYASMAALSAFKYDLEDEEGKHHLVEETKASASALVIIAGTIIGAEGLNADIEEMYELNTGKEATRSDKVALMNLLASVVSPVATTVGSASLIKKVSNELADGDENVMAICVSHISNLSGFVLFGDPPFIAVAEKYGFKEGVEWQLRTMLPLAMYSLASATFKLNYILNRKEGLTKAEATAQATKDTVRGIKNNIPVLARIVAKSLGNVAKYYTAGILTDKYPQTPAGIEVRIGEVMKTSLSNMAKLPFAAEFDKTHDPEAHHGLIHDDNKEVNAVNDFAAKLINNKSDQSISPNRHSELITAIQQEDYARVEELAKELNVPDIKVFVDTLRDYHDNHKLDDSVNSEVEPYKLKELLNPIDVYDRATSVHRIQNALGHNLADVVNVFPFQAGCVPFLIPIFKMAIDGLEGLDEQMQEAIAFFMIMIFSMMADNYVGCKIGLELYPEKPQIALIASIQGGSMTAIGNMANIAQFDTNTYPLMSSIKKMGWHMDDVAVTFAWNKALDAMNGIGFFAPPKAPATTSGVQGHTRREFFNTFSG